MRKVQSKDKDFYSPTYSQLSCQVWILKEDGVGTLLAKILNEIQLVFRHENGERNSQPPLYHGGSLTNLCREPQSSVDQVCLPVNNTHDFWKLTYFVIF